MTQGKVFSAALSLAALVTFALLLSACKKSDSTSPTNTPGSVITVSGKVIGQNKQPVAGVPVLIAGLTSVNTDGSGNFTIANVTIPYSVTVVDGTAKRAIVYRGLSRSDPTLIWLGASPGTLKTATLSGNMIPWLATGATTKTAVAFISPEASGSATATAATGAYSMGGISWYGAATTVGSLHALQWDFDAATSLPTSFKKYGVRAGVTLLDGATNPNGNDTLSAVTSGSITGTVTASAGYTIGSKYAITMLGLTGGIGIAIESNSVGSFSYVTPNIPGSTITLEGIATKTGAASSVAFKSGISPSATGVSLSIPAAPELSLPVNAATGVKTSTPFSWNPVPGGAYLLQITGGAGNPSYVVLTTATSDSIPNLASLGLGLPAAAAYTWSVLAVAPFASVDAAVTGDGFLGGINSLTTDHSYGFTAGRTFTTAP